MTDDPPSPRHSTDPDILLAALRATEPDRYPPRDGIIAIICVLIVTWVILTILAIFVWGS